MKLTFTDEAWDEYLYWQVKDKRVLKKINTLIKDIKRDYIVIPRNVKLAESPSFGKPVILYDVQSSGSIAYQNLAQAIIK